MHEAPHVLAPLRPTAARHGMVVAGEPLAASAGLAALAEGGHAVDAAVATAAVMTVTMPDMCGLGGDAFALVYDAAMRTVTAFNGSGPAPAAATLARYRDAGYEQMPLTGWWSAAVPGAVGVWTALHDRYARLPLERLLRPAIGYATDGFPARSGLAESIALERDRLAADLWCAAVFLSGGRAPRAGEVVRMHELAVTYRELLDDPSALYDGGLARTIGDASQRAGGLLTREDLTGYRADVCAPLSVEYRGHRVFTTPPPSQGLVLLEALNLVEGFDVAALDPAGAEAVHLLVEAIVLAFADRNAYLGDPRFVDAPVARLLSKAYADRRRPAIQLDMASLTTVAGDLGDTTSFVVVDADGNGVSFIHSLSHRFGAAVTAGDTGIVLNNRAGRGFVLDDGHPNGLAPGKRTMHTLNAYVVTDGDGDLVLVGNTPGGDGQPQWNLQAISNVVDHGMDVAQAVAAPRWRTLPGSDPETLQLARTLHVEDRFPAETLKALRARGHDLRVIRGWEMPGSLCLIARAGPAVWEGAADPRDHGVSLGL